MPPFIQQTVECFAPPDTALRLFQEDSRETLEEKVREMVDEEVGVSCWTVRTALSIWVNTFSLF